MSRHTHPKRPQTSGRHHGAPPAVVPFRPPVVYRVHRAPAPQRPPVELTPAQVSTLRQRGLLHPECASAWLVREVAAEAEARAEKHRQALDAHPPRPTQRPRPITDAVRERVAADRARLGMDAA